MRTLLYSVFEDNQFLPPVLEVEVEKRRYFFDRRDDQLRVYRILDDAVSRTVDKTPSFLVYSDPQLGDLLDNPLSDYTINPSYLELVQELPVTIEFVRGTSSQGFDVYTHDMKSMYVFDSDTEKLQLVEKE